MHLQPPFKSCNSGCFLYLILPICLLFANLNLSAQYFKPFQANTQAMFTTWPEKGATSSLSFINAVEEGADSIFTTLKTIDSQDWDNMIFPDSSCTEGFWSTGGLCFPLNTPLWYGTEIRQSSELVYRYVNAIGDTMLFDFSINQADSSLIYQDDDQHFYLIYQNSDTATYLNHMDSVANYRMAHLDVNGSPINSAVHDAPIVIGQELGMIHFIRIDSFPHILQPVQLVGHVGAEAGLSAIMVKDVFDFNPGDFFQYKYEQSSVPFIIPGYTEYRNMTILSRTETVDEIFYSRAVEKTRFHGTYEIINGEYTFVPDTTFSLDTTVLAVSKTLILAQIPLEAQDTSTSYQYQSLQFIPDDCGSNWRFSTKDSKLDYCTADSIGCYGDHSNNSPGDSYAIDGFNTFGKGLGVLFSYEGWGEISGNSSTQTTTLLYSVKNGWPCGEQWVLSTTTPEVVKNRLQLYPNPAQTSFQVEIPDINEEITQIEIFDLQGRVVLHQKGISTRQNISIEKLPSGIYVVKASTQKLAYTQKLMVNR